MLFPLTRKAKKVSLTGQVYFGTAIVSFCSIASIGSPAAIIPNKGIVTNS